MALPAKRRRSNRTDHHLWPLGAFAELVATACAASTHLHIDAHPSPPHITLLDNGPGHPSATLSALTAPSPWRTAATTIGSSLALLTTLSDGTATAAVLTDPPLMLHWASMSPHHPDLPKFLQATPWSSYEQVAAAFRRLPSSGSLLVIYNLKSNPSNHSTTQLDLSDPHDIRCPSTSNNRLSSSLRAYLQLLFLRPKARIHLRGRIVRERKLASMMWGRTDFLYTPRSVQDSVATMRFGFDPHAVGDEFGMLIYCRGRLIRPFVRVGPQVPGGDVRVVGIIEADFLSPTRNMQNFERDKLYQGLVFSIDRSLKAFWGKYGSMNKVLQVHSRDIVRKWTRCDDCGYWRIVAVRDGALNPEDISCSRWVCSMNVGGTVNCGAPDDADTAVDVGNRRIFGAGKSKTEFSAALKKMRNTTPIDASKLGTDSHPSMEAAHRRPRAPQQSASNWAVNGVAGESLRSSPATTAGVSAGNINVAEMNTTGDSLLREPNLDLDQPTPELVSPELHFNSDEFSLSRNGVASPPAVAPVSASRGLPPTSVALFASSGTSPRVAYGPIEAFLRNVEAKEAPLHGDASMLNKSRESEGKGTEEIRTSMASEAEQKISLVSSSYGLGDTPMLGRPAQAVGGGDTLRSSSSVTHDEVAKSDVVNDSVIDIMDTANGANCQIFPTRTAFEPQTILNEQPGAVMPAATISQPNSLKGQDSIRITPSSALISPPPAQRENIELGPFDNARSNRVEPISTPTPNGHPENDRSGRIDSDHGARGNQYAAANALGINTANDCGENGPTDKFPSTVRQGANDAQLFPPPSEGTDRYNGFRFSDLSRENGKLMPGKVQMMRASQDPPELNGGVTTSSAFQVNASNLEKGSGLEGNDSVKDRDHSSSRQGGLDRESTTEKRGSSFVTEVNSKGGKQGAGAERRNAILQRSPLDEVVMTKLLDFGDGDEIGVSGLHDRPDVPSQGTQQGIIVDSENHQLPPVRALTGQSRDKASLLLGELGHGKLDNRRQEPACQPMDVGSDGTEPFEKEASNHIEDRENQPGSDDDVHGMASNRPQHNSSSRTQKGMEQSDRLNSSRRDSTEIGPRRTDRSLSLKRRHEGGVPQGEGNIEEYSRSGRQQKKSHVGTHTMKRDDTQRHGEDPDKRRRLGDSLAIATRAATSAAKAALSGLENGDANQTKGRAPNSSNPKELTWSQLALSAAVAAGAAAAAATTASQSQREVQNNASRGLVRAERKFRNLMSRLVPTADEAELDNMETLNVERVAEDIQKRIKREEREDVARAATKQHEDYRRELKSKKEELRNLRRLVHIFLDKVVGILNTDNTNGPIETQLEYYLRLLDALPPDDPS
eukprot:GFKZ01001878.1.p1 GENE.GFKZ01001878.1~~GFKZ01001878.1.p1  ORF type:complete len:1377 (+),score=192.66 GFKZ01001878.1:101-4132(+)